MKDHPNLLQNIFLCCWNDLPFLSPLFFLFGILGQQLFKHKYPSVVPIYYSWSHVLKTSFLKLKREVSRTEKRLKTAIMFSGHRLPSREQRSGFVKAHHKQVSDRLHVFAGFILPLNPSQLQFMLGLYFTPSLQSLFCILHPACILLSHCSLHFTLRLHFTAGLQSAVPSLLPGLYNCLSVIIHGLYHDCNIKMHLDKHKIHYMAYNSNCNSYD